MPVLKADRLVVVYYVEEKDVGVMRSDEIYLSVGDDLVLDELRRYGLLESFHPATYYLYPNGTVSTSRIQQRLEEISKMSIEQYIKDIS